MPERTEARTTTEEGTLVIERIFDAPRELVWKAWSDPEMAKRWWGPKGFTAPAAEIDFRVGGKELLAMQSPDFNEGRPIWSVGITRKSCISSASSSPTASRTKTVTSSPPRTTGCRATSRSRCW
jgi:Activator of Hsp90 ATPase homolog 1-like protein